MQDGSKSHAQVLVEERTSRSLPELLRELYVERRHSQDEIARALTAKVQPASISRATVSDWLREYGITRDDRPAVAL